MDTPPPIDPPSAVFDPLELDRGPLSGELGEFGEHQLVWELDPPAPGGMGRIWLARHGLFARARLVVVKLMRAELIELSRARDYFWNEAEALMRVRHVNVVHGFGYGIRYQPDPVQPYLAMECLDGLTLAVATQHCRSQATRPGGGPWPNLARTVHLLAQACAGVDALHRAGLIHCDIKPANLMVCDWLGTADCVKVIDAGLAREPQRAPRSNIPEGTPAYRAPEQGKADGQWDERTDVYALGGAAYFALTGLPPAPPAVRAAPSVFCPRVPPALDAVVLKALDPDPQARFASAAALRDALVACPVPDTWTPDDARKWWDDPLVRALAQPSLAGGGKYPV